MCFSHKWRAEGLCSFQVESQINIPLNAALKLGKLHPNSQIAFLYICHKTAPITYGNVFI